MKVIYILWLRQLKRFVRKKASVVGALGQPVLYLFALGFGFGPIFARAGGGDYIQFLAPGVIAMTILFSATFTGLEVIWDKQFGFLKETLVAPVSRFQIMIGKTLGGATVALAQGIMVFLITFIAGFRPTNYAMIPVALVFMTLIAILFSAAGSAIAARMEDMQGFPIIMNFVLMPLFFLSGTLFPINELPKALSAIITINPLSYGVDGIRGALTSSAHFSLTTNFIVLSLVALAFIFIGARQFSKIEV